MRESRKNIRIAIFNGPYQKQLITNYSVNMSSGGVFIETENIRPVDTLLVIKFKIPGNDIIITCKARIAWINDPGSLQKPSLHPGMGIQFVDLSLDNIQAIRNFLKEGDLKPIW